MFNSPVELAMVFGVALLVFGPKKLPELGRSLGLGIGNFKKSLQEAQDEVKNAMKTEPATVTSEQGATLQPANRTAEPSLTASTTVTAEAATKEPGSCCGGSHQHGH